MLVAFSTPASGSVASAITQRGSAEAVRALLIQCGIVECPVSLGWLTRRDLVIERVAADDTVLASASYAIPCVGGNDRALTFQIDAAIYEGAAVRARIDGCATGETQWVVINYEFQPLGG